MKNEIYDLKQALRTWYSRNDSYLTQNGFHRSASESTLYTKVNEQGNMLIVFMYVDDLIFTGDFGIKDFKAVMESEFEMIDLGLMKFFLGIEVQESQSSVFISNSKYATVVLKIFNMSNCKVSRALAITGLKLSKDDNGSTINHMLFKNAGWKPYVFNCDKTMHHVWSKYDLKIHGVTKRLSLARR